MNEAHPVWDAIIIGAGMSGLSARRAFAENGLSSLTLEKSRGLGGRASTRRMEGVCADLGAQFTSAKGRYWQSLIESAKADGVLPIYLQSDSKHPRYVHAQGMSRLAALFVKDPLNPEAPILKETRVLRVEAAGSGKFWDVIDQSDRRHRSRALLLTPPLPQAMELISQSKISLDESQRHRFEEITYTRCISAAYVLNEETNLAPPGILKEPSPRLSAGISGIFDQRKKGLLTSAPTVVVQASAALSLELWDEPSDLLLETLWKKAGVATQASFHSKHSKNFKLGWIQKWKYCEPLRPFDSAFERVKTPGAAPLVMAGDTFGGSKIEGAVTSGREAALAVVKYLNSSESAQ
jgi:predicted NAD/FAD-dependent oxidoreductase